MIYGKQEIIRVLKKIDSGAMDNIRSRVRAAYRPAVKENLQELIESGHVVVRQEDKKTFYSLVRKPNLLCFKWNSKNLRFLEETVQ